MSSMSWVERTTGRRRRPGLVAGLTAAVLVLAACGGTTGDEAAESPADDGTVSVFGAFATPIEEPWDGVVHSALQELADAGKIDYKHADNIGYSGGMERSLPCPHRLPRAAIWIRALTVAVSAKGGARIAAREHPAMC